MENPFYIESNFEIKKHRQTFLNDKRIKLLKAIKRNGSIRSASSDIKMSYQQAWHFIKDMNEISPLPLVVYQRGGSNGGGTELTKHGELAIVEFEKLKIKLMNMQQQFTTDSHLITRNGNGYIDTVLVGEEVVLETSIGKLIPRYTLDDDAGRKKEAPIKFFKTGELKSLPLEKITEIQTSVGDIKSELVIFYKSGALHRIFPLNGKVTGFWTEENEYELAETVEIPTPLGAIKVKPIYLQFYESGELESILFWPNEQIKIKTKLGEILIHKGITFYKNGNLKGFEPVKEIEIESPIGKLNVFDPDPNAIQAESNSVSFYEDETIQSVITSSNKVTALKDGVEYKVFSPKLVSSYCNENDFFISPLKILFEEDTVSFNNINEPVESTPRGLQYNISKFVPIKPISEVGCG